MGELQAQYAPKSLTDLIPAQDVRAVGSWLADQLEESETIAKAGAALGDVRYPQKERERGRISVAVDPWQTLHSTYYYERPAAFGFDSLRDMVNGTPILSAILPQGERVQIVMPPACERSGWMMAMPPAANTLLKSKRENMRSPAAIGICVMAARRG